MSAPATTVELATALASKNIPSTPTTSQ
jgi:hypothetical protein